MLVSRWFVGLVSAVAMLAVASSLVSAGVAKTVDTLTCPRKPRIGVVSTRANTKWRAVPHEGTLDYVALVAYSTYLRCFYTDAAGQQRGFLQPQVFRDVLSLMHPLRRVLRRKKTTRNIIAQCDFCDI